MPDNPNTGEVTVDVDDAPWPKTKTTRMEDGENTGEPTTAPEFVDDLPETRGRKGDPRKAFLREVADKVLDKPDLGREDSYQTIARFWTTYLHAIGLDGDIKLEDYDVALMMDLFKTARLTHDPHHADSWVDKAGYAVGGYEKAVVDRPKPIEGM